MPNEFVPAFLQRPYVQALAALILGIFCTLAIVATVKLSNWGQAAIFSAIEVVLVYTLIAKTLQRDRAERLGTFLAERNRAREAESDANTSESGLERLRAFRAQEPTTLRRPLQIRLLVATLAVAAFVLVVIALTH